MQGKKYKNLFWVSAISPLVSVILSTFIVFVSNAEEKGVQIVRPLFVLFLLCCVEAMC